MERNENELRAEQLLAVYIGKDGRIYNASLSRRVPKDVPGGLSILDYYDIRDSIARDDQIPPEDVVILNIIPLRQLADDMGAVQVRRK